MKFPIGRRQTADGDAHGAGLKRSAVGAHCPCGQNMRTRCRAPPLETVLDRRARVGRSNKYDLGNADLLLAIPKLDPADVAIEIKGDGSDVSGTIKTALRARVRKGRG